MRVALSLLILAAILLVNQPANALDLVRDGRPVTTIVVPDDALPVETAAAAELQYHVQKASGAQVPIAKESEAREGAGLVYIGACKATQALGLDKATLPANGFVMRLKESNLFLFGDDTDGEPFWVQHNNRNRVGTLFAVYELLETRLGVRWLWPGDLGTVVPRRATITIDACDETGQPAFIHTRWRDGGNTVAGPKGWGDPSNRARFIQEQAKWLRRHRFAMGINMDMAHSFTNWWARFGEDHPEYFNLLPDGTRRVDPNDHGGAPELISMCVSEPGVVRQKVADWAARRTPQNPYIDASENDTPGKCTCDLCMAMDEPHPDSPVPFDRRAAIAKERFEAKDPNWAEALGSLSDRYARFYLAVQKEAEKVDPEVVVMGYSYANYVRPPVNTRLNERIIIGIVPALMYPWTAEKRAGFREQWEGWRATGCQMFLRPNYTLDGHGLPIFFANKLGEDFTFAAARGLVGTDFDSLTGQYAIQGPNLYMLARLTDDPTLAPQEVMDEYYSAFGNAEAAVREYFAHWERVSDAATDDDVTHWSYFYREADRLFTPDVMAEGRRLLDAATLAARGDTDAEARVAFLDKGLTNAEMVLATQRAYRAYKETGQLQGYADALGALDEYRASIESDLCLNMGFLHWSEGYTWDRELVRLMAQPGERLPDSWKFAFDPARRGEELGWAGIDFDDSAWETMPTNGPWEQQEAGKRYREETGTDYNGLAWYRNRFDIGASEQPRRISLVFGAVDEACTVWVNGVKVLERPYPYQGNTNSWLEAFEVDITAAVRPGSNVLAVRVEDNQGAGGIWKPVWLVVSEGATGSADNLLGDGTFENGPGPWRTHVQCGKFELAVDKTVARTGSASARITCSELAPPEAFDTYRTRAWARWHMPAKVEAGKAYRLRAWVKTTPDFAGTVWIWVTGTPKGTVEGKMLNTGGLWRLVTIENAVAAADGLGIYLNLYDAVGTVWFDDVELTEQRAE
ncbi:MAG: DUF4838 domain-containing protein [Armatimonadetes bacterium]|nr:DUF4838 domain-containing protein [Armatimonadota bacterium]